MKIGNLKEKLIERLKELAAKKFHKLIVDLYARVSIHLKRPFVISATEMQSKKGKIKKTLLVVETQTGKLTYVIEPGKVIIDNHPSFLKTKADEKID